MNIYTYYDKIPKDFKSTRFDNQDLMIDIWSKNWREKGYNPIVLNIKHAKSHKYYDELITGIKSIHMQLVKKPINIYCLSCFVRWLAYATQNDSKMIVSDYDVINNNWENSELMDKLHIMGTGPNPCFASGTPSQFTKLARLFVDLTEKNISNNTYIKNGRRWHDQNAIIGNIHDFPRDFIHFSDTVDSRIDENWRKKPLLHISYDFTMGYKNRYKKSGSIDRIRIELMKELLNMQKI